MLHHRFANATQTSKCKIWSIQYDGEEKTNIKLLFRSKTMLCWTDIILHNTLASGLMWRIFHIILSVPQNIVWFWRMLWQLAPIVYFTGLEKKWQDLVIEGWPGSWQAMVVGELWNYLWRIVTGGWTRVDHVISDSACSLLDTVEFLRPLW